MTWRTAGAMLAVLSVVFIIGQVWFHVVEKGLSGLKRLFGKKEPAAWHPLPPEQEENEDV